MLRLRVQRADTRGPIQLVRAEDIEVAVERPHIDMRMHRRLTAIEQHRHALAMRQLHDLGGRGHGAEHVRHMREGDELRLRPDEAGEVIDIQRAVIADARPFQHRALPLAQEVPRHDVGVMLHLGEHDLIARLDQGAEETLSHQVERLGAAMRQDDLLALAGVHIGPRRIARRLIGVRRRAGEIVHPAMNIRVARLHEAGHRVDHALRLLRRSGVVEIDQRLAIDLAVQHRKIGAHAGDVKSARCWLDRVHAASRSCRRISTKARIASAAGVPGRRSRPSCRKASVSIALASRSGMPRARR